MKIKHALEQDFKWIAAIQESAQMSIWKPNTTSWVVGKSAFAIWQKIDNECELLSLAVKEKSRGRGYAMQLMRFSHKELHRLGVDKFFLEVKESNKAALLLYQKLGYEKIAERKRYYYGEEAALVMKFEGI
jgi:ribosomal protein S18 acetylase RimI-like enzyme